MVGNLYTFADRLRHRGRRGAAALVLGGGGLGLGLGGCGLLDRSPPTLRLGPAPGPGADPVAVTVAAADPGGTGVAEVAVQLDDGPWRPLAGERWHQPRSALAHGPHTLRVRARDRAWPAHTTIAQRDFVVDRQPPVLTVDDRSRAAAPATVLGLLVHADEALVAPRAVGLGQDVPLVPAEPGAEAGPGWWRGLLGVPIATPPGHSAVVIHAADTNENTVEMTIPVEIQAREFPDGGTIRLSRRQTAARKDQAAIDAMRATRDAAYTWWHPTALWSGAMLRPVAGRRSSAFGRVRRYSDGTRRHHLGTDLADRRGSPVVASNAGIVKAAGWQHLFGNAVIINHGLALATSYNHLDSVAVAPGDRVEKGQVIGTLGSTGQSTGPHLHWGMQVGTVEVDPEAWPADGFALPRPGPAPDPG